MSYAWISQPICKPVSRRERWIAGRSDDTTMQRERNGLTGLHHLRDHLVVPEAPEARATQVHEHRGFGALRDEAQHVDQSRNAGAVESLPESMRLAGVHQGEFRGGEVAHREQHAVHHHVVAAHGHRHAVGGELDVHFHEAHAEIQRRLERGQRVFRMSGRRRRRGQRDEGSGLISWRDAICRRLQTCRRAPPCVRLRSTLGAGAPRVHRRGARARDSHHMQNAEIATGCGAYHL